MLGVILVSAALGILVFIMSGGTKEKVVGKGNAAIKSVKVLVDKVKELVKSTFNAAKGVINKLLGK